MPFAASSVGSPMPDSCRICGLPIEPVASTTSPPGASCAVHRLAAAERRDLDAGRANAVEDDAVDVGAGPDLQVRARECRLQEGLGRVPADAGALVDVEVADAFVVAAVEVVAARQAGLDGGGEKGVEDRPVQALLLDAPFAALALAGRIEPGRGVERVGALVEVLVLEEVRQALAPAPARVGAVAVADAPAVVVARLPAHVDHAVDAARAAQHLAARIAQAPAVQAGGGLGRVQPVGARVADAIEVADRDVDPEVVVAAAGLDHEDVLATIGAEPVGEQAAGGAGAADDVVVANVAHGQRRPVASTGKSFTRPSDITSTARAASSRPISRVMTLMPVRPTTRAMRPARPNAIQIASAMTTP